MVLDTKLKFEDMTSPEVKAAVVESGGVVVLPVGACEQHGPHLPVNSDTLGALGTVMAAAEQARVVVAPAIPWGNSLQMAGLPGTITLQPATLRALLADILSNLLRNGFTKLVILNGHGGNLPSINDVAEQFKHDHPQVFICIGNTWELDQVPGPQGAAVYEGHAGAKETSVILYLAQENVDPARFALSTPRVELNPQAMAAPAMGGPAKPFAVLMSADQYTTLGHLGDPTKATRELGQKIIEAQAKTLADFLLALKQQALDT